VDRILGCRAETDALTAGLQGTGLDLTTCGSETAIQDAVQKRRKG